jgi:hypothetical protein
MTSVSISEIVHIDEFSRKYKHLFDLKMTFLPNKGDILQINDKVFKVKSKVFDIKFSYHATEPESQEVILYVEQINK